MHTRLMIAGICRAVARGISIFLIVILVLYILFIALQVLSGEPAFSGIFLYLFLLVVMCGGFILCWKDERLGSIVASLAILGYYMLGWGMVEIRQQALDAPTTGAVMLVAALVKPQSFDPLPTWIQVTSWLLLALPVGLFLASWALRRSLPPTEKEQVKT